MKTRKISKTLIEREIESVKNGALYTCLECFTKVRGKYNGTEIDQSGKPFYCDKHQKPPHTPTQGEESNMEAKKIVKGRIFNHQDGMSELKKFQESNYHHTPTPWVSDMSTVLSDDPSLWDELTEEPKDEAYICSVINRADAAFIVRAVNAHEELVSLLKEWKSTPFFEYQFQWKKWINEFKPRVEKAIAKAEGR